jgi:hypothetical protein
MAMACLATPLAEQTCKRWRQGDEQESRIRVGKANKRGLTRRCSGQVERRGQPAYWSQEKKGNKMKRLAALLAALLVVAITLWPQSTAAQSTTKVNGGGTGTFGVDLDGDGDIDGSQFGMGVVIQGDGSAQGHFECLMAGRSQMMGLHLMAVEGPITKASVTAGGITMNGIGTVKMMSGSAPVTLTGMPFTVKVAAGGPGIGTMQLTVPGMTPPLSLPTETVSTGQIVLH